MTKKTVKIGLSILFFGLLFLLKPSDAMAVEMNFYSNSGNFYPAQTVVVNFSVNSRGKNINTIKGKITYPKNILDLQEIRDGGSIINLWVERPQISSGQDVSFAGVSTGGFKDDNGFIFSLIFKVRENKSGYDQKGLISFRNAEILLNDGLGTKIDVSDAGYSFFQKTEAFTGISGSNEAFIEDRDSPSVFSPYVTRDQNIFDNRWVLIFSAQDKSSGVDHYEVHETKERYPLEELNKKQLTWLTVESPYLLQDQNLESYVYVKAVDRAGNERLAVVFPGKSQKSGSFYSGVFFSILIIIVIVSAAFFRKRKTCFRKS